MVHNSAPLHICSTSNLYMTMVHHHHIRITAAIAAANEAAHLTSWCWRVLLWVGCAVVIALQQYTCNLAITATHDTLPRAASAAREPTPGGGLVFHWDYIMIMLWWWTERGDRCVRMRRDKWESRCTELPRRCAAPKPPFFLIENETLAKTQPISKRSNKTNPT